MSSDWDTVSPPPTNKYHVVEVLGDNGGREMRNARGKLQQALELRKTFQKSRPQDVSQADASAAMAGPVKFHMEDGVMVFEGHLWRPIPYFKYVNHYTELQRSVPWSRPMGKSGFQVERAMVGSH